MNSASLCSLAGRYDSPIPARFLAPIDFFKIPAQASIPCEDQFCRGTDSQEGGMEDPRRKSIPALKINIWFPTQFQESYLLP